MASQFEQYLAERLNDPDVLRGYLSAMTHDEIVELLHSQSTRVAALADDWEGAASRLYAVAELADELSAIPVRAAARDMELRAAQLHAVLRGGAVQ